MKKTKSIIVAVVAIVAIGTMAFTSEAVKNTVKAAGDNFIPKDPKKDNLLTSENSVLLVIDWQQEMLGVVQNIDQEVLTNNIQGMIKTANVFSIPVVESTIGVELGANKPTVPEIKEVIKGDVQNIDRISLNAWQNQAVIDAVKATGRKK